MPDAGDRRSVVLVDSSAAIALVLEGHEHHAAAFAALGRRHRGLAGHAAFETYSVLTRVPGASRMTPPTVTRLLEADFPETRFLDPPEARALLARLGAEHIAGGAVYDALVGAVAAAHALPLATRDRRALDTYRAVGADVELIA